MHIMNSFPTTIPGFVTANIISPSCFQSGLQTEVALCGHFSSILTGAVAEWIKAVTFEAMKLGNRDVRGSIPSRMKYILIVSFAICITLSFLSTCCGQSKVYKKSGDFIVGGLVPLHLSSSDGRECGELRGVESLRHVEAIVYAVSKINNDTSILDGFSLGYEIYDTCSSTVKTLENALSFVPTSRKIDDVIGVVGPQRSSSSIQATNLLGLYNISVVSYLSSSDELSDSDAYPYFLRTVAPDKFQVSAIVDILLHFNWTYAAFLYSDDSYGRNAEEAFQKQTTANSICVAYVNGLPFPSVGNTEYLNVLRETILDLIELKKNSLLSVVILYVQLEIARDFFALVSNEGIENDFIWIGSDGWGNYDLDILTGYESAALGAFTVVKTSEPDPKFDAYFQSSLTSGNDNPWIPEFSLNPKECQLDRTSCNLSDESNTSSFEALIIDSVQVIARGLDAMRNERCNGSMNASCRDLLLANRRLLRDHLLNVTFNSSSNGLVAFTDNGDSRGRYSIRYLNLTEDDGYRFYKVGSWSETDGAGVLVIGEVIWHLKRNTSLIGSTYYDNNIPKSVCADPCGLLEVQISDFVDQCCWTCDVCEDNQIIVNNECVSCFQEDDRRYMWPDESLSYCRPLEYLKLKDEGGKIVILLLASLGLVADIIVTVLYIKNRNKTLINASNSELSYIVLIGIFLSYLSAIFYSMPPANGTCVLRRIVPNIATTFIYVPIAMMTILLYRLSTSGPRTKMGLNFIRPQTQVMMALTLSLIPLLWAITWIFVEPPNVNIIEPSAGRQFVETVCVDSTSHIVGQLFWDFGVLLMCCAFAFLARKFPANFNQTRFIAFCVFFTLVVYVAFAPAYFTSRQAIQRDLYIGIGAVIQSTVVLTVIFGARIYAIYVVSEEDQSVVMTEARTRKDAPPNTSSSKKTDRSERPNEKTHPGASSKIQSISNISHA